MWCFQFIQSVECKGHTGPVCAADAIYVEDSKILVASSASDSTVKLWLCCDAKQGKRLKKEWLIYSSITVAVIPEIDSYTTILLILNLNDVPIERNSPSAWISCLGCWSSPKNPELIVRDGCNDHKQ